MGIKFNIKNDDVVMSKEDFKDLIFDWLDSRCYGEQFMSPKLLDMLKDDERFDKLLFVTNFIEYEPYNLQYRIDIPKEYEEYRDYILDLFKDSSIYTCKSGITSEKEALENLDNLSKEMDEKIELAKYEYNKNKKLDK